MMQKEIAETLAIYMKQIQKYKLLSSDDESKLAKAIRRGDTKALNKLIESNLRFVVSVAVNYQHQGIELPDLIQMGNRGLVSAAKRFDETKNFKFISYAVWWIRQAILQGIADHSRPVRVPINQTVKLVNVIKTRDKLLGMLHRMPTQHEIETHLGTEIGPLLLLINKPQSLDAPIDDSRTGYDLLSDFTFVNEMNQNHSDAQIKKQITKILDGLSDRDRSIIEWYYGFHEAPQTLDEIGSKLNITRERVRQIKAKLLRQFKEGQVQQNEHKRKTA
jgi:RNA polymerase primary sigma factor